MGKIDCGTSRLEDIKRFYQIIGILEDRFGGARKLSDCKGQLSWPNRGVYFFFEPGEYRNESGDGDRIVRVGTHALTAGSKTTLWNRLRQHKGIARTGGGNHRGSIFRLLVGASLLNRDNLNCFTWGKGSSASPDIRRSEEELEKRVSQVLGRMKVLCLDIEDNPGPASLRATIERNSISLLSNSERDVIDPPSPGWLGLNCPRTAVVNSGTWNQNHCNENYDRDFLDILENLAQKQKKAS